MGLDGGPGSKNDYAGEAQQQFTPTLRLQELGEHTQRHKQEEKKQEGDLIRHHFFFSK
jgi:hypothetical protein